MRVDTNSRCEIEIAKNRYILIIKVYLVNDDRQII